MATIRANRAAIDDRFNVLGFTVRSETPLFEIALATDPELFRAERRGDRNATNFYSSRILRAAPSQRGEAVYMVPPTAVARFVGQPRLYFGLATYRENDRNTPLAIRVPDRGAMYISLSGLTERGFRRSLRGGGGGTYGAANDDSLQWGGDTLGGGATPPNRSGGGGGGGGGGAGAGAGDGGYSDGYSDELWRQPAAGSAAPAPSASPAPAPAPAPDPGAAPQLDAGAPAPTAQGLSASARSLLISSDYRPSNLWDALRAQLSFFVDSAMWYLGVSDTRVMPHAAICQIRRPDGSPEGALHGSGFFIGPRLIMTAAHVVDSQSELIVVRGKNGGGVSGGTEPFGRFTVRRFRKHGSYDGRSSDFDIALIEVPADKAVGSGQYFDLVEELNQSRPEGVVVTGYAARWYAHDAIEHFVNDTIDPNKQHMMGGHIRALPTDETFTYNIQTLGGTSGSPVYWIEDTGSGAQAHMVGVHVAAHDATTNRGCRITAGKLSWIRQVAGEWGQSLSFSLGATDAAADRGVAASRALSPISADTRGYGLVDSLRRQLGFFADSARWFFGVEDTRQMPYAAICQVRLPNGDHQGTAFYIAPRLLLTAAHVVRNQSSLTIVPGKNGDGTGSAQEPFGRFTATRFEIFDGYSGRGDYDRDMALIEVPAAHAAPAGRFFPLVEELNESRPEGVVVSGYAVRSHGTGLVDRAINATIDPDLQHMMGGHVRDLPTDETFSYDIQSLGGTSGSPVYWIEDAAAAPVAHMVGVHVSGNDAHSNLGCRITAPKLNWIRRVAGRWGHTLSFSLGARDAHAPALDGAASRALEIITPYYDPSDPDTALTCQDNAFSLEMEEWFVGVESTAAFPHSAICQLIMRDAAGGTSVGTGFYIGRNRILTCAHNLSGKSQVTIIPGKNGAGTGSAQEPFGRTTAQSSSWRVAPGYTGSGHWDRDLAVIDGVSIAAPHGQWFEFLNATPSDRLPLVVCGYSRKSVTVPALTALMDGDKQHLHGGFAQRMPTPDTIDYPILTLKRASGSPVYTIVREDGRLKARICAVHVSGEPAAEGLNRGCFITPTKIDWIEGRSTTFAFEAGAAAAHGGGAGHAAGTDDDSRDIGGPIPDAPHADGAQARRAAQPQALTLTAPEYPQARRYEPAHTGNYRRSTGDRSIEKVVIHITDGGASIDGTIAWFKNPDARVSAHYVIGQDGEVVQMVAHNDVAWHAGSANAHSIGIEHVANTRGLNPTVRQLEASAALVAWLCDRYGIPVDRDHIQGHAEADTRTTHSGCPNAVWNWDYYMQLLQTRSSVTPPAGMPLSLGARALEADGPIEHAVHLIPQPDKNSCWAASMAMLISFRRIASHDPEALVREIGASLNSSYDWDLLQALRRRHRFEVIEQTSNASIYHSPRQWAQWLNAHGPLWVVIVGAPHAVVVSGIRGNLDDAAATQVRILNPWDTRVQFDDDPVAFHPANQGYADWMSFADFARDFGEMAEPDYGNWRILYLPASAAAGGAQAKSLSAGMPARRPDEREVDDPQRIRLPDPPADEHGDSRATARAMDGGAGAAIASAIAGAVMERLANNEGDITWELDQLRGFKHPNDRAPDPMPPAQNGRTIRLTGWPTIEVGFLFTDEISAGFEINWQYNGRSVGNVMISNIATNDAAGMGLTVKAKIMDDNIVYPRENPTHAALWIRLEYRFTHWVRGDSIAIRDVHLFGDGTYTVSGRWEQ